MIITANIKFYKTPTFAHFRKAKLLRHMLDKGLREPFAPQLLVGEPLMAIVNRGRWIVRCECGGAEYAWEEGIFMCQSCLNAAHGHHYRPVIFPKQRRRIEALIEKRAIPNRNWEAIDSLADLEADNILHEDLLIG